MYKDNQSQIAIRVPQIQANEIFSEQYLKWVKETNQSSLTNGQHEFAEWLLKSENYKMVSRIGGMTEIFISVRKFLKNQK